MGGVPKLTNMRYVIRVVRFYLSPQTIVMLRKSVNFPPPKSGRPLRSVVISQFRRLLWRNCDQQKEKHWHEKHNNGH